MRRYAPTLIANDDDRQVWARTRRRRVDDALVRGSGRRGALLRSCPPASPPPLLRCAVHPTGLSHVRAAVDRGARPSASGPKQSLKMLQSSRSMATDATVASCSSVSLAPSFLHHWVIQRVRQDLHEHCHPSHLPRYDGVASTRANRIDGLRCKDVGINQKWLFVWDGYGHGSAHITWANGEHFDAGSSQFYSHAFAKGDHRCLRRAVGACTWQTANASHTGNTNKPSATPGLHRRDEGLEGSQRAKSVCSEHLTEGNEITLALQIDRNRNAGASDDDIW